MSAILMRRKKRSI